MNLLIITQKVDQNDQLLGFFIEWLRRFAQKFGKITVICLEKSEHDLPKNVKVISFGKERFVGSDVRRIRVFISKFGLLLKFYKHILQERKNYDAVFVHMNPIWMVLGGLCWKILGKKRFLWYTSGGVTSKLKLAEKFADTIFTASKESFRLPSKKVIVTGHGINTELFQPSTKRLAPSDKLRILSVGRIAPVKNYETLIGATQILKNDKVDFEVTIVGEAPLKEDKNYELRIKNKIKELGLEENFNFVGKVGHEELPEYYQSHDLFVHLSKTGSLDKTILEAMACGMNVLSSNDSSHAFLPSELVFKGDDPVELAKKMTALKDQAVGSKLRNYVIQNHNLDVLVDKISKHIQQ